MISKKKSSNYTSLVFVVGASDHVGLLDAVVDELAEIQVGRGHVQVRVGEVEGVEVEGLMGGQVH